MSANARALQGARPRAFHQVCPILLDPITESTLQMTAEAYVSYGVNRYGFLPTKSDEPGYQPVRPEMVPAPAELLTVVDSEIWNQPNEGWYYAQWYWFFSDPDNAAIIRRRHKGFVNTLYLDGHAQRQSLQDLKTAYNQAPWIEGVYTVY